MTRAQDPQSTRQQKQAPCAHKLVAKNCLLYFGGGLFGEVFGLEKDVGEWWFCNLGYIAAFP